MRPPRRNGEEYHPFSECCNLPEQNQPAMSKMQDHASIDAYIAAQPQTKQEALQQLRTIIRKAAPGAEETISYGMPAFHYKGPVVYFALFKSHYGFYPKPAAIKVFAAQLTGYETSKGAIRLPFDKPFPTKLITAIVKFNLRENEVKEARKASTKKVKA
jgi:uncharacterized protein YdhG (YjbR/CyaY superfamily)